MKMRTATLLTLALAVIVAAITVTIGQLPDDHSAPGSDAAPSAPESAEPPRRTAAPEEPAPTNSSRPSPDAGGQEENSSREGAGPLGPPVAPVEPLISPPLPKTASQTGKLVTGFPSAVISLAPGSTVMFSSVASEGDRVQVGLSAMSTIAPAEVLAHYSTALAGLGLVAGSAPAVDGSTAAAFIRGPNTVTVTVLSVGGGTRYSVFGVLVAGR